MCGVCGIVSLDSRPVDGSTLEEMNASLFHRGPDSGGMHVDGRVGIAARRLAIIDLAGGDQPIANEDGSIHVVQNGEIYNYRELRRELERSGHTFATRSDTEVLVHLYEDFGPLFVSRLRGMFAIALLDTRQQRVVLARDRFGIKPLYYSLADQSVSFASELKALLRIPGSSREIDLDALDAFLAFGYIPAPLTIFRDARKLPPGSLLICDLRTKDVSTERYARPKATPSSEIHREDERVLAAEVRERLRDSVRAHLVSDVPVGVFLSGGIDSSALTALAAEESPRRLSTFTIGFEERHFDERSHARIVADRWNTDHHELVLRPDVAELLPALAEAFDEPFADGSAIPTYLVSQLAREHVKVVLTGEGADELFGGYNYYVGHRLAPTVGKLSTAIGPVVEWLPTSMAKSSTLEYRLKRFTRSAQLPTLDRHYRWKTIMPAEQRSALLLPDHRPPHDPRELLSELFNESEGVDDLARVMDVDIAFSLVDDMLVKTDRASMAHSLEARVPFLDTVVADLALALPSSFKVQGLSKKRLLKRAVAPLVPESILKGEKKGFAMPLAAWLRDELRPMTSDLLSPANIRRQGFFRPDAVTTLLADHHEQRADNHRQIWSLLVFSLWYDRFGVA